MYNNIRNEILKETGKETLITDREIDIIRKEVGRKEVKRLEGELANVESEIKRASGKLANSGFLAKAPKALVDSERAKLDKYIDMRNKLAMQIKDLKG